jgi:hypothetical protein
MPPCPRTRRLENILKVRKDGTLWSGFSSMCWSFQIQRARTAISHHSMSLYLALPSPRWGYRRLELLRLAKRTCHGRRLADRSRNINLEHCQHPEAIFRFQNQPYPMFTPSRHTYPNTAILQLPRICMDFRFQ